MSVNKLGFVCVCVFSKLLHLTRHAAARPPAAAPRVPLWGTLNVLHGVSAPFMFFCSLMDSGRKIPPGSGARGDADLVSRSRVEGQSPYYDFGFQRV